MSKPITVKLFVSELNGGQNVVRPMEPSDKLNYVYLDETRENCSLISIFKNEYKNEF